MTDKIPETESQALRDKITQMKCDAFDYLRHFANGVYNPVHCGYKDKAHALETIITNRADEIEKEIRKLERKYPIR